MVQRFNNESALCVSVDHVMVKDEKKTMVTMGSNSRVVVVDMTENRKIREVTEISDNVAACKTV